MGLESAGLECRWQCEIERKPSSVLMRHWPGKKLFSDVRAIKAKELEPVDVLVGGFPCQDLSVAGKREGLKGERSGLFYELARIAKAIKPLFVVFENVPGLLSSEDGRDFARVIRHLGDIGYCGAWRVLDAQFFGVAQRRERVFGVFARRDIGAMRCAEILALTEGVSRHPAKGGKAGKGTAGTSDGEPGGSRKLAGTITANGKAAGSATNQDAENGLLVAFGGNDTRGPIATATATATKTRIDFDSETLIAFAHQQGGNHDLRYSRNKGLAVQSHQGQAVVYAIQELACSENLDAGPGGKGYQSDLAYTLEARHHVQGVAERRGVRRLTPRECERLMGWPDDWSRWAHDGKEIADGPRYKMIGNGVVKPVARWIGRRLMESS